MKRSLQILLTLLVVAPIALSAAIVIPTDGENVYTQNFASLSGGTWSDDGTLSGWYADWPNEPNWIAVPSGGSNGLIRYYDVYTPTAEYGLGSRNTSGNNIVVFGAEFQNGTGSEINGINIDYQGEQWYHGTQTTDAGLVFEYSTDATSLSTGTWTAVSALDFDAPLTGGTGVLLGTPSVISSIASDITLSVANGGTFWIRWTDTDDGTGTDHGLAVDSFKLDVTVVPEPSTYALMLGFLALGGVLLRRRLRS